MSETNIGLAIDRPMWHVRFGVSWSDGYFAWVPGEIESGWTEPANNFNAGRESYVFYGWLCFRLYYSWGSR